MSFFREVEIKSVRKARACGGCGTLIEAGSPAVDLASHYDGDFWSATYHRECRKAEVDLNSEHQAEEWIPLQEFDPEDDWEIILEDHPIVAARLGITQERIDEIHETARRMREHWRLEAERREAARKAAVAALPSIHRPAP
jgi:hypothetical protein